jgi:hypothetical protein
MHGARALFIALLALGLLVLASRRQLERFADAPRSPWDRRPISTSVDNDPVVKYKKAYYNELGNSAYVAALQGLFQLSCEIQRDAEASISGWKTGPVPPEGAAGAYVTEAYNAAVSHISERVFSETGARALALPDESDRAKVQLVYDMLAEYGVGPVDEAAVGAGGPPALRLTIECVFYRFGKFHGKHLQFIVMAKPELLGTSEAAVPTWKIFVLGVRILGVISADQIGMYPVEASDPSGSSVLPIAEGVAGAKAPYPTTLLTQDETLAMLMEQQRKMQSYLEAEGAVAGYATIGETLS